MLAVGLSHTFVPSASKGGLKSERVEVYARLKNIFQISYLNYYVQYMTKIKYKEHLIYFKLKNTTILEFNSKLQ